jgi:fibronectin-binding autotransporter adhesin
MNTQLAQAARYHGWLARLLSTAVGLWIMLLAVESVSAAAFVKADNTTDLNLAGSWATAGVPGSGDIAWWDNTFAPANNSAALGTNLTWAGIIVTNNLQSSFTINATGTNALTLGTGGVNMSNANQSFTINSPVIQGSNQTWIVNAGQSLTLDGAVNGGSASADGTYNLTLSGSGTVGFNGSYADGGTDSKGQAILINSNTVNINPGTGGSFVSAKKVVIGNIAGSLTTVNIQSGTTAWITTNYLVMSDNATASSVLNVTGGQMLINNTTYPFVVGLKGTGVVSVASSTLFIGSNSLATFGSYSSSGFTGADGTLNINNGGTVIVSNSTQYFALGNGGPSSYGTGHLNLNSGGTLVCGRNIIKNQANAKGYVTFNGGTLKVATNSATFMQGLTAATISTNGATIDDGGLAVTIAQPLLHDATLVADGGLAKQGAGTLTLSGTNTYNGTTAVNAGSLVITPASAGAPGSYLLATGATLKVRANFAGDVMGVSAMTLNSGSALTLDESSLSGPLIVVANALTTGSTVTLNLTNMTIVTAGQYPLISYGSLGGAGAAGFVLGATPQVSGLVLSVVNNAANHTVDLLAAPTTQVLTWNGTLNGTWDIGGAANWKSGALYTQTGGTGPIVTFDDSASGTTAITLGVTVSPTSVVVSNANLTYSVIGAGQIAGSGGLVKQGNGTFTLATLNTMTNATLILGGTLQLGDGAAYDGSVGGGILDNAALVVANPNSQTMNNVISGSGSLTKSGSGTLTLTSSNTLSGAVTVNAGTLALNPGGAGGTVPVLGAVSSVTIGSGSALTMAGANALGLSTNPVVPPVIIAGNASLSATGPGSHAIGSLSLGDYSTGGTLSGPGGIVVNGNFTNISASAVNLGNLSCNSTNILLTGSGTPTLTVNGNFNLVAPGSGTYETVITGDPNGSPAILTTTGNVTVNRSYLELEYLTWNFDLGTNTFNFTNKFTIGKNPGLPALMSWNSGNGFIAISNNFFTIADAIGNNNGAVGELDVNGGNLVISNTAGGRCLIGNAGTATISVSGGSLSFTGNAMVEIGGDITYPQNGASGTLTISGGSVVLGPATPALMVGVAGTNKSGVTATSVTGTVNLNGGTLTSWAGIVPGSTTGSSYLNFNGGTLKAGTNNRAFLQGLTSATVQPGGAIIDDGGYNVVIGEALVDGGGGLAKLGAGTLVLTNSSTYSGQTTVSNGTLLVDGSVSGSGVSVVQGTLGGVGTIAAPVAIGSAGVLTPGSNGLGTLTINGDLQLGGSLLVGVNKSLSQSNGMIVVSGLETNSGSGVVTITNSGTGFAVGDTFQLFNQPVLNGEALSVTSGGGVVWTNMLAVNGTIQVLSVAPAINPLPGVLQQSVSGGLVQISWPTNLGWILQAQTNPISTGLTTNWVNVLGSQTITNSSIQVNPAEGSVFYRLVHP